MYVILVYDLTDNKNRVHKLCKKYLNWVQNSVFEGEITVANLKILKIEIKKLISDNDSVLVFDSKHRLNLNKDIIGNEKNCITNFI